MNQAMMSFQYLYWRIRLLKNLIRQLKHILPQREPKAAGSENSRYILKDGYNGTVFLAWKENRIVLISGLSTDQAAIADRYTSEILR